MKKQFRSTAKSGRAAPGATAFGGFGASSDSSKSALSYAFELPDLSLVTNANTVVQLKSLTKKDATTKSKALEELQTSIVSTDVPPEDGLLGAWARFYPRLSIDTSRRVRQLSHNVLGQLASRSGKRIVPQMPHLIGPWLSGTFDSDKGVARAAVESLHKTFSTAEKRRELWRAFQRPLIEYCRDALLYETPQTLCDERVVSKEDAEAIYHRVVSTALVVVTTLISTQAIEDLDKISDVFSEIMTADTVWNLTSDSDNSTRRAAFGLLQGALASSSIKPLLDFAQIGSTLISKALVADQISTAGDLIKTITELTLQSPSVWTTDYRSKRTPDTRLRLALKKGAQSSSATFWPALAALFDNIPPEALPQEPSTAELLLDSLLEGVTLREERLHAKAAWQAFLHVFDKLTHSLPVPETQESVRKFVMPVIDQYLAPTESRTRWTLAGPNSAGIAASTINCRGVPQILTEEWAGRTTRLLDSMKASLPEQSKSHSQSQDEVAASAQKFIALQAEIIEHDSSHAELIEVFRAQLAFIVDGAIELLTSRRGKPYSAALLLEYVERSRSELKLEDEVHRRIVVFLASHAGVMLGSPSQSFLLGIIFDVLDTHDARLTLEAWTASLLAEDEGGAQQDSFERFVTCAHTRQGHSLLKEDPAFQSALMRKCSKDSGFDSSMYDYMSTKTKDEVLVDSMNTLDIEASSASAISVIEAIDAAEPEALHDFMAKSEGRAIVARLSKLMTSTNSDLAERATVLHERLIGDDTSEQSKPVSIDLLDHELNVATKTSIPIESVLTMISRSLTISSGDMWTLLVRLLRTWEGEFDALPTSSVSLALVHVLGSLAFITETSQNPSLPPPQLDGQGFSRALRIAMFAVTLLEHEQDRQPSTELSITIKLLLWTAEVVNDDLSLSYQHGQFVSGINHSNQDITVEFVSRARQLVNNFLNQANTTLPPLSTALESCLPAQGSHAPLNVLKARSYLDILSHHLDVHGFDKGTMQVLEAQMKSARQKKDTIALATSAAAGAPHLSQSPTLQRVCNELVSDLTSADPKADPESTLGHTMVLRIILQQADHIEGVVAKQRLVFLLKHSLPWLSDNDVAASIRAELAGVFRAILPQLADVYGSHWSELLSAIVRIWSQGFCEGGKLDDTALVVVFAALQVHSVLLELSQGDEANEDLVEALQEQKSATDTALLKLLCQPQPVDDETHAPLKIVNNRVARQARRLSNVSAEAAADLFPILDSKSRAIQDAAFALLQQYSETAQEQISVDAALEKKAVHLPEELLSFVLAAPDPDHIMDASFDTAIPELLQSYLYSWLLIFSNFTRASIKVREDYSEDIKSGEYLSPLLDLIFELLGHKSGKAINVSRFDITRYERGTEDSPERDAQWLMTHLYYLSLLYLPTLTKMHYLSITNRQTSMSISAWTAKHISPSIVSAALASVQSWTDSFASDPEYENFAIKISARAREITASYLIDEQTMAIAVRFPDSYPLTGASVDSVSRVAVDQRKWMSWLRNCAGVIQFSNGDVVDGLSSWRRNVIGALKGKGECAICYSIVSADKQLPSKRCGTCKNLFHSGCLYKWFKSSGGSTCPLCRNSFNYG